MWKLGNAKILGDIDFRVFVDPIYRYTQVCVFYVSISSIYYSDYSSIWNTVSSVNRRGRLLFK